MLGEKIRQRTFLILGSKTWIVWTPKICIKHSITSYLRWGVPVNCWLFFLFCCSVHMFILVCGLLSVDFVLTHLSRLVPARTGNSVLLTQQYRMFSPGGKANTKRLPRLSSFWDLTELDCSRQKDSWFWGKTLSIISCALSVVTPWHLPWKLQVLLGAEVEFDWNKYNMIVMLQRGSKENFHKVCAIQHHFSSCHICWCVKLKCRFVFNPSLYNSLRILKM